MSIIKWPYSLAPTVDNFGRLTSIRLTRYHILVPLHHWVGSVGGGVEVEGSWSEGRGKGEVGGGGGGIGG